MIGAERGDRGGPRLWRRLEELNLNPGLALESLFVRLRRELAAPAA